MPKAKLPVLTPLNVVFTHHADMTTAMQKLGQAFNGLFEDFNPVLDR